jgi:hypothetical protein
LHERKLEELNAKQTVVAAACLSDRTSVTYEPRNGLRVVARQDSDDPTTFAVTVYDEHGRVLRQYNPESLPVKQLD